MPATWFPVGPCGLFFFFFLSQLAVFFQLISAAFSMAETERAPETVFSKILGV